jgi:aminobenzoyl-glutamate utilization protein A
MDKKEMLSQLVSYRRDFHKYAESGWTEFRTTAKIAAALNGLGYQLRFGGDFIKPDFVMGRTIDADRERRRAVEQGADPEIIKRIGDYTGLVAELDTGRAGPTAAFRFDIDAVDVEEASDDSHRPVREGFASVNKGWMHACGHDGHTAIGVVLAKLLAEEKDILRGKIRLIFQPAEEGVRGGYAVTKSGAVEGADYFTALHLGLDLPTGTICGATNGLLCTTKFDAIFKGKGAHAGGEPERGKNALLAAASAALNLHAIAPHSGGRTRLNVGVLNAGEGRNVVPPSALMKIETRGETKELADYIYGRAQEVIKGAAMMYGNEVKVVKRGESPTSVCSPELAAVIMKAAKETEGVTTICAERTAGGSDDACWLINRTQEQGGLATYMAIGASNTAGHHNAYFDFDEAALPIAVQILEKTVLDLCGAESVKE